AARQPGFEDVGAARRRERAARTRAHGGTTRRASAARRRAERGADRSPPVADRVRRAVTALARFLEEEIAAGSFPAASVLVAKGDRVLAEEVAGHASLEPQVEGVTPDTLFDLASLTKPLATAAILASSGGALPLDAAPG